MYESRTKPLLSRRAFFARLFRSVWLAAAILSLSLGIGMAGYHWLERMGWLDAFANASMILSGMGPLAPPQTAAGKLFAGCYALFSGLVFLTCAGVIFAPVFHRFLHKFHLEAEHKKGE